MFRYRKRIVGHTCRLLVQRKSIRNRQKEWTSTPLISWRYLIWSWSNWDKSVLLPPENTGWLQLKQALDQKFHPNSRWESRWIGTSHDRESSHLQERPGCRTENNRSLPSDPRLQGLKHTSTEQVEPFAFCRPRSKRRCSRKLRQCSLSPKYILGSTYGLCFLNIHPCWVNVSCRNSGLRYTLIN